MTLDANAYKLRVRKQKILVSPVSGQKLAVIVEREDLFWFLGIHDSLIALARGVVLVNVVSQADNIIDIILASGVPVRIEEPVWPI